MNMKPDVINLLNAQPAKTASLEKILWIISIYAHYLRDASSARSSFIPKMSISMRKSAISLNNALFVVKNSLVK